VLKVPPYFDLGVLRVLPYFDLGVLRMLLSGRKTETGRV
jgi:hypothetical protein